MAYKVSESQEHKDLIAEYIKHGFTKLGFMGLIKQHIPKHHHSELYKLMPDCYRFDGKVIQCLEIQHSSKVKYDKLIKYGLIEELLFDAKNIRLDVIEHRIEGNSIFVHHQQYAYEQYFEGFNEYLDSEAKNYMNYQKSFPFSKELHGNKIPKVWFNS